MASDPTTHRDELEQQATAYVFGELDPEQAAEFATKLEASSELQTIVASIREAITALETEFAAHTPGVSDLDRERIQNAIESPRSTATAVTLSVTPSAGRRWIVVLASAAAVLLVAGLTLPAVQRATTTQRINDELRQKIALIEQENRQLRDEKLVREQKQSLSRASGVPHTPAPGDATADSNSGAVRSQTVQSAMQQAGQSSATPNNSMLHESGGKSEPDSGRLKSVAGAPPTAGDSGRQAFSAPRGEIKEMEEIIQPTASGKPMNAASEMELAQSGLGASPGASGVDALSFQRDGRTATPAAPPAPAGEPSITAGNAPASEAPANLGAAIAAPESSTPQVRGLSEEQAPVNEFKMSHFGGSQGLAETSGRRKKRSVNGKSDFGVETDDMMGMGGMMEGAQAGGYGGGMEMGDMMMSGRARSAQIATLPAELARNVATKEAVDGLSVAERVEGFQTRLYGRPQIVRSGDRFAPIVDNPFRKVTQAPLSTFSIDVDTAAYAKVRMALQSGQLPDPNAVRIEEMINYFSYDYAPPNDDRPFAAAMDVASCPWNAKHRLARIGIKGKVIDQERPASNLVFLLDVSGSMNRPNKLPLVISGMKMLVNQLEENDSVAIVVYAGAAGLVLDSTSGDRKKVIYDALDRLRAGGSTNGGQGIQLAYDVARDHFIDGGTNRVILCSDGDFNVGVTGTDQLVNLAADNAKDDIFLSVLGFGTGNHNDDMMEKISNQGNGNYAFIDSEDEARKVFVDQMQGTLVTIAKDVKIQVEFNPAEVQSYRLIGYANRMLAAEDFNDDTKDAGEIGAGHTVTALYEIVPTKRSSDNGEPRPLVDDLKYQRQVAFSEQADNGELLTLKLRYKPPTEDESLLIEFPVSDDGKRFDQADQDFQFAASVAAFGMLLRNSSFKGDANFDMVLELASSAAEEDPSGYRDELVSLIGKAKQLSGR